MTIRGRTTGKKEKIVFERKSEMKNTKILVLVLSLALVLGAVAGITVSAADETLETTSIAIKSANLSFVNEPALVFAVEHDGDAANVSLNVWNSEPEENQAADYVVTDSFEQTIEGTAYTSFAVEGKNPKNIYEYVWVQAVAGDVKSEIVRYSILQYALGGVVKGVNTERFQSIIDYSASAQKWLEYTDANGKTADEYVFVSVDGGTVDGYKNGVYPVGTQITPVGDGVAMWSVESDSNKYNSYYGQPITLTSNTKITVNNSVMTFENCTDISDINGATLSTGAISSPYKISELDGNKVLTVDTKNDGSTNAQAQIILGMNNTITDAEAVVLEFDLYIEDRAAQKQVFAIEMRDTSNQRIVYLTIDSGLALNYVLPPVTTVSNANVTMDSWMKFRVEYLDLGETKGLKVYVNDNPVLVLDDYVCTYNSPTSREITAITNVRFDTYEELVTHFDNVVLMQEKIENLDKVITFDNGEVSSNITVDSTYGANLEVVNDSEKGNVLKFESAATYGEGFTIPVLDKDTEYNCVAFEADISIDVLDNAGYPGVRFHFVNSAGNTARFELKRNSGNIEFVQYTCSDHYSSPSVILSADGIENWFNFRIEYYGGDRDTVRTKVYLNGDLIFVSDDFISPVNNCSVCNTSVSPATVDSITTLKVMSPSGSYTGTMLIDNIVFEKIAKTCADDPLTE